MKDEQRGCRFFFTVFGPAYAITSPVNGGVYPHQHPYVCNLDVQEGELMLLYCTKSYPGHCREAPGIGLVTGVQCNGSREIIKYQFFPFRIPVKLGTLRQTVPELGKRVLSSKGNWVFEICSKSFAESSTVS